MAKVRVTFFCVQEKKKYYVGDEYTGNRTDLGAFLEPKKATKKQDKRQKDNWEAAENRKINKKIKKK